MVLLIISLNLSGRILNRFSKDIGCMDEMLPATFFDVITIFLTAIGILMLVGAVNLWLLLPIFFLGIIFFKFRQFYLVTARSVKRLESTSKILNQLLNFQIFNERFIELQLEARFLRIYQLH